MTPRFRGKVGKGDDGKFYFDLSVWNFTATTCFDSYTIGPFDAEETAHHEMRVLVDKLCKDLQAKAGEKPTGEYVDMLDKGTLKKFDDIN